jgi:hypothetical protein
MTFEVYRLSLGHKRDVTTDISHVTSEHDEEITFLKTGK